jgi:uncharacterized membrane protein YfcA
LKKRGTVPLPLTFESILVIALSAFLVGFSKTSVGGLVILVVPLIALAVPGPESTGLLLPMLAMADVLAVMAYHRSCEWTVFKRIFPITAIGVVIGYLIMDHLPHDIFGPILGALVLFLLAIGWILEKRPVSPTGNRIITWIVGISAGISTMVANAAGPLMGIYLLQQGLPKKNFVGTRSWYFLVLNLFKLPFSTHLGFVTASSLKINFFALPLIVIGALVGVVVLKFINVTLFKWIIRTVATVSAVKLLIG